MQLRNAIPCLVLALIGAVACSSGGSTVTGANATTPTPDDGGAALEDGSTTVDPPGPAECAKGCGDNQVCSEGACVDLPKTCPCPVESYCDLASGSCKAGCTKNEECSQGRFCNASARTCKNGCRTELDCARPVNGTVTCDTGTCNASCDASFHACGKACKGDTDVTACGAACTVCPTRPNATASCTGGTCKSACLSAFHECAGSCASNTAPATCGTSCSPCPTVLHGQPTCNGTACGVQCNAGYVPSVAGAATTCVESCTTAGCGAFQWCDPVSLLCKAGCEVHTECGSTQFCKIATHTCENTTSSAAFCPAGFVSRATCSDGRDMCVNASLPPGTTYKFESACPAGSTARGSTVCSGSTYVCVPN